MENNYSDECYEVLKMLKERRNVLISGAPGTGKSWLLGQVAQAFIDSFEVEVPTPTPIHSLTTRVPIPRVTTSDVNRRLQNIWPALIGLNRKVFRTVFHQNYKYRDFLSGVIPFIGGDGNQRFEISEGILYRSSEFAKLPDSASLLIIDEINRGPAVQIFGGSIVAIEPDKRLNNENSPTPETQFFELLNPESGQLVEYAFPENLYILAAMNQADVSVEPLDVAFLRRWAPISMVPSLRVLYNFFDIEENIQSPLPDNPSTVKDIYCAAVLAWEAINKRIKLGRGGEFQLGHGIFLVGHRNPPNDIPHALNFISESWGYISAHVEEVFFGDPRAISAALNIRPDVFHPYQLETAIFADEPRLNISCPNKIDSSNVYALLKAII
jgi:5-methylcytosine-specific restriction enzyme B